jgi:hypothetical protein
MLSVGKLMVEKSFLEYINITREKRNKMIKANQVPIIALRKE